MRDRSRRAVRGVQPGEHPTQILIDQYEELKKQEAQIAKSLASLKAALLREVRATRRGIDTGTHTVTLTKNPGAPRISEQKLLGLGVTARIIKRATERTPFEYAKVTRKKPEGDEGREGA